MSERVVTEVDRGIARVELNRPAKRNGLDMAMFEALVAAGESIREDRRVRAVVLCGAGSAFCAGLDFKWFMENPAEGQRLLERPASSPANLAQRAVWIWQEIPVPVIAAVNGVAFGGGLQIALGADLRCVAADAAMSVMEIEYGLIPDMSISKTLPRLVRPDVARELVFTGRVVDGEEAVAIGLATRVAEDPLGAAIETAERIAQKSPDAIRAGKRLLAEAPDRPLAAAFELETELQLQLLGTPNQMEAVSARLGNRSPAFRDPE